ncbi:MAG: copper homeostasis protein CutC [Paramuribaculum sp.]|nr:copper homeostasis protein CutC [Paramuribaculum sp.]
MSHKLEICCGDIQSVKAAAEGGADRIELCCALSEGGLTPSAGLIRAARQMAPETGLHVLIRPREGDFVYDEAETECMAEDIRTAKELGADGVVIGALTQEGEIDTDLCRHLIEQAGEMSVTFHRAFDRCRDMGPALEQIIALGCDRILTSGQAASAYEGAGRLAELKRLAAGRIMIMAGAGVTPENAREILGRSMADELHASAREEIAGPEETPAVKMGSNDGGRRKVTSARIVRALKDIAASE